MSNLTKKNRYSGVKSGQSFERAKGSSVSLFRAKINLKNARDPGWVIGGGWSAKQVRRIIRESIVILGRQTQKYENRSERQMQSINRIAASAINKAARQ